MAKRLPEECIKNTWPVGLWSKFWILFVKRWRTFVHWSEMSGNDVTLDTKRVTLNVNISGSEAIVPYRFAPYFDWNWSEKSHESNRERQHMMSVLCLLLPAMILIEKPGNKGEGSANLEEFVERLLAALQLIEQRDERVPDPGSAHQRQNPVVGRHVLHDSPTRSTKVSKEIDPVTGRVGCAKKIVNTMFIVVMLLATLS